MKKYLAAAALTASFAGITVSAAPAMAVGDDGGTTSASGNGSHGAVGNSTTAGRQSPQLAAVSDTLNRLCLGVPAKANVGSLVGVLVPVTVQDVQLLSSPQNQQCADNSGQAKNDEPLSHLLNNIPVLSANGGGNR
ncbi:rodlin [Streptomyces tsukubensis]|uniref:RdlA protein n=1 Tax=Streptomyces tsukubensis TaxID=83656 RepID=A0A1V4A883_9ACTN|nr:rodlin [Streptomyces tsukubensis]OON78057.1 RdlA protein [Streptomyces tsukubensis]QFR97222.1 RdlA protein [Streptomyces tsukubensis]